MFTINLRLILAVMALVGLSKAEIASNLDDEDRKPSMFKVGDDWRSHFQKCSAILTFRPTVHLHRKRT